MSNGEVNCILAVCCPDGSEAQREALTAEIMKGHPHYGHVDARRIADWIIDHFDLAPKGSLVQLKAEIATLARGPQG